MDWINKTKFYPLSVRDVLVQVQVEAGPIHFGDMGGCRVCHERFDEMGIVKAVYAVNWEGIADVNLEMIVSHSRNPPSDCL